MSFAAGWYAVALSDGLAPGTSAGTRLFDREIVVWRDQAGVAHAWEDRCPHRGMRLSFGFVRGNHIACLYHGWQYDAEGSCRYIPAHPQLKVPDTIRVASYPCRERLGMIFVHSELDSEAPPPLPADESTVTPVRSLYVDRAPDAVLHRLRAGGLADLPAAPGETPPRDLQPLPGSLLRLNLGERTLAERSIIAALQPFGESKTALHLVILAAPEHCGGATRKSLARWAEALRHELEASPAVASGAQASELAP